MESRAWRTKKRQTIEHPARLDQPVIRRGLPAAALLLCAVVALLVLAGGAEGTHEITVENLNDSGPGSLRQAIEDADPGSIIINGAGAGPILLEEALVINKDVTIRGERLIMGAPPGTMVLDGQETVRVLQVEVGVDVTISGVTIQNGNTAGSAGAQGGGILNQGTLTILDSTIRDNTASGGSGGGISNAVSGASLTVTRSVVSGNTADVHGGGILNTPGGALAITESRIIDNHARGLGGSGAGGGVFSNGVMVITESTMSGNKAEETGFQGARGGGVYAGGTATIERSTITGNEANFGGGVYSPSFVNPPGPTVTITQSTISDNLASRGGGIYNFGATMTVSASTIAGNTAPSGQGGGIHDVGSGSTTVAHSIVALNSAEDCEGTIASDGNNLASDSTCGFTGPGDLQDTDPLLGPVEDNGGPTFTRLPAQDSPAVDSIPAADCQATDQRGATRSVGTHCDMGAVERHPAEYSVTTNADSGPGSLRRGIIPAEVETITFADDYTILLESTLTIDTDVTIHGNGPGHTILDGQAAVRVLRVLETGSLSADGLTIRNGKIDGSFWDSGGGIHNLGTLIVSNSVITGNQASQSGGGIYGHWTGTVTILDSLLSDNTGGLVGGGIRDRSDTLTISQSVFTGNSASRGGAISTSPPFGAQIVTITDSVLEDNTASTLGGAIHSGGSSGLQLTIERSTIRDNKIFGVGGGVVASSGSVEILESVFTGNEARQGGAAHIGPSATLTIKESTFTGNKANPGPGTNAGGAIFNAGTFVATASTFVGNTADEAGGGIHTDPGATTLLAQSIVAGNTPKDCGGDEGVASNGHNLDSDETCFGPDETDLAGIADPMLGDLQDNGGPTLTMLPLPGSPVLDQVPAEACESTVDQRGLARPSGDGCDIGAVERQSTFVVTTLADAGPGTLRIGLTQPESDRVTFAVDGVILLDSQLVITRDVTIQGNGPENTILDGQDSVRVIQTQVGTKVTVADVTIQNGNTAGNPQDSGGGIHNSGDLAIAGSTISGNTADFGGGIFAFPGGVLAITDSTISGNTAGTSGGGIRNSGDLTITSSTINGNTASTGGGGIHNSGDLAITGSTIGGNTAVIGGGIRSFHGDLAITESTISGNTADFGGGISNRAFLAIIESTISGNTANHDGGGIYNIDGGELTITESTISGNTANRNGGGSFNDEATMALAATGVFDNMAGEEADNRFFLTKIMLLIPLVPELTTTGHTLLSGSLTAPPGNYRIDAYTTELADCANVAPGDRATRAFLGSQVVTADADGDAQFQVTLEPPSGAAFLVVATATFLEGGDPVHTGHPSPCLQAPAAPTGGGGGGGGVPLAPQESAQRTAFPDAIVPGAEASWQTSPASLAAGGTLEVVFPSTEGIIQRIEVDFHEERTGVSLHAHRFGSPPDIEGPDPDSGYRALYYLNIELRDAQGPIPPEAVHQVRLGLRAGQDDGEPAERLVVLRHEPGVGWVGHPTRVLENGAQSTTVEGTLPGFSLLALAVDETPPEITFIDALADEEAELQPGDPLQVRVADNRGVAEVQMFIDGEEVPVTFDGSIATHVPEQPMLAGAYTLTVTAMDESGQEATASQGFTIAVPPGDVGFAVEGADDDRLASPAGTSVLPWVLLVVLASLLVVGYTQRGRLASVYRDMRERARTRTAVAPAEEETQLGESHEERIHRVVNRVGYVVIDIPQETIERINTAAARIPLSAPRFLALFDQVGSTYCHESVPDCDSCPLGYRCDHKRIRDEAENAPAAPSDSWGSWSSE